MSPRIHILPEDLINKIAAGEVVERPASVVKELIENSIDAGSTQIIVEIEAAGKKLIRVSDNGCGLSEQEIELALQRHSTSKINSLDDLFNIKTLGFRGEALPSIASVSKMTLSPNPSGAGLTAEVKNLFYNTPARRKFMKSDATEVGHIGDIIAKYVMANPQIAFRFVSDGKPLLSSAGTDKLTDAVLAVYGANLTKELIEIDCRFQAGRISGLVSRPTISRLDKNYETFYVNGRYIKNFLLNRALEEAYRTLIPGNRYPVAVIFIEIDPKQVDVNVHPTKREVKFANNQVVMDGVRAAVRGALGDQAIRISGSGGQEISVSERTEWRPEMMEPFFLITNNPETTTKQEIEMQVSSNQPLLPIYQLKLTYIIATDGQEIVLIDQHAAHERIIYDRLSRGNFGDEQAAEKRQAMLIPETIEFSAKEAADLRDNLADLNGYGFEVEEFGVNSFLLRTVPAVAFKAGSKQLLIDLVSELGEFGKAAQHEVKKENIRKLIACHSAIKAGDKLIPTEMNQLIKYLYATENPLTCPHGRPTMVRLTEEELKKRFGR